MDDGARVFPGAFRLRDGPRADRVSYGFRVISSASPSLSHPGRACARPGAGSCGRGCPSNARAGEGFLREELKAPSPGSDFASLILATLSRNSFTQARASAAWAGEGKGGSRRDCSEAIKRKPYHTIGPYV